MQQYNSIKAKYPDALLLFRVGDFYETFSEDAIKASKVLGIVLTKRSNGAASDMELAGFPHHSLDTYLPKLVRAGMRVAICDQLEDPKTTKKIVKRGVTEVVTPGVTFSDKILDHKSNNFLAAFYPASESGSKSGLALVDASTGEFYVAEGNSDYIDKLLQSFQPSEVLVPRSAKANFEQKYGQRFYTYSLDDWAFQLLFARETLLKHFQTISMKGFGVEEMQAGVVAAGAALYYLQQTRQETLVHISALSRMEEDRYVWLDRFTIRNLELVNSPHENARTLLSVLDFTVSPMGGRMLRRWLLLPLKEIIPIKERQDNVEVLTKSEELLEKLQADLKGVGDLERIASRIAIRKLGPREAMQLKRSLLLLAPMKEQLEKISHPGLKAIAGRLHSCEELLNKLTMALSDDPPALLNKGGTFRKGYHAALDELKELAFEGKDYLLKIQREESEKTGITSLKIAFNNVFGYYIEVTNVHKNKVPASWVRKQTLTNAERYITEELKQYEEKILGAEEKIQKIEETLYAELLEYMSTYILLLQQNASEMARLDCLCSFASVAMKYGYVKPTLDESLILNIRNGRHPVLEQQLPLGESYIPNDVYLDNEQQQIIIITGPNMAGKSAILRQTALIVLMAQTGCFVPAQEATIGMVDKIFTRVGASDNLSQGESTFMVEMNETASILHNITNRSLVLLDEIGRGTSTYDGISIAWAIAEFIHDHPTAKAKTLFATHYHELNEMAESFGRIKNFSIAIHESGNKILFLRKLIPGGSEHSFGIHVAQMAGMPSKVLKRAQQMLETLEKAHGLNEIVKSSDAKAKKDELQLSFFQLDDPVLEQIRDEILQTDINTLTPVEALMKLNEIKKLISREKVNLNA
ncbi:MAG: DNA mismatch repair protein MutS [Bacteroidetes bacterium]|nr:DNA mismatch repair protein MutS [Bacteroidota bacterium]